MNSTLPYYQNEYVFITSQIIGYIAGIFVLSLNLPQIFLIIKKKLLIIFHLLLFI